MAFTIKVNGTHPQRRCRRRHASALGAARRARHDRHQVRLRRGAVRRLHRARRRCSDALLRHHHRQHRRQRRSPPSRPSARRRRARRCSRPGSISRWCNAAIASPARSCRPRRCWRTRRSRAMPTSTPPCPAMSAAAAPISAFAPPSTAPRQAEGGSIMSRHFDRHSRARSPRLPQGRRRHRRRPRPRRCRCQPRLRPAAWARGEASRAGFAPERLHPHRPPGRRDAGDADGRDGPGHLHVPGHAAGRGAGGRPRSGPAGACPAQRRALRQCDPPRQTTGLSSSVRAFWTPLRQAGAVARTLLIAAAAKQWGVDPATCRRGTAWSRTPPARANWAMAHLADAAAALPVPAPDSIALKDPKDFTLIGTPAKRLDTPDKVNGRAQFGIDTQIAGHEDRGDRHLPRVRRQAEIGERGGGARGQGRAPGGPDRQCRRRGRRPYGRGQEGARGGRDPMGRRPERRAEQRRHRPPARGGVEAAGRGGPQRRRCPEGARQCRSADRCRLSGAVSRPCADGADELHRPCSARMAATSGWAPRRRR